MKKAKKVTKKVVKKIVDNKKPKISIDPNPVRKCTFIDSDGFRIEGGSRMEIMKKRQARRDNGEIK